MNARAILSRSMAAALSMTGLSERQRYWLLGDIAGHHRLPHVELLIFDDRCIEIEEGRPSRY